MKRRITSLLLALGMALLPAAGAAEEETELFISAGELVIDRSEQTDGEDALDKVNQDNASILEQLGKKDWAALAASVQKQGDWREDLIAVAQTQVGYAEEADGMTIYTAWAEYEEPQDWTALFISWVAEQSGRTEAQFPRLDTYEAFTERMRKIHALKNIGRSAYPMPGDLALIEKADQQLIGVVVYVSNGVASVITGDDNGAVTLDLYSVGKTGFMQYIDLNELMARAGVEVGKGGKVPVIPEGGAAGWTNTNGVYMRREPTTASKRVVTVKMAGTAVLVVSAEMQKDGFIWYGVEYGGYQGYIRSDLLELDMAALQNASAATQAPDSTEVPGGAGLQLQERVVNIDVKKAQAGEEITISFEMAGASKYQWYQVETVEEIVDGVSVTREVITLLEGENAETLTVAAKPGAAIGYYCVATLMLKDVETEMTSKRTLISVDDTPIVAEAILGEEVNFTYECEGAESYRWYRLAPEAELPETVQSEDPQTVDTAKFTTYALAEHAGAVYYCEALDADGQVLAVSSRFVYTVNTEDLCKYVDELVNMTRTERYDIMTGLWQEAGLAQGVLAHWKHGCDGVHFSAYYRLLCSCSETVLHPSGDQHAAYCGWYDEVKEPVNTGSLTITRTGLRAGESAIFKVTATPAAANAAAQEYFIVLSGPDGSAAAAATLTNLLAGSSYTITEQTGWAWSYASDAAQTATGTIAAGSTVTETFSGAKIGLWLHDESSVTSGFGAADDNEGGEQ